MTPTEERPCSRCVRETFHVRRGKAWACTDCGTVNQVPESDDLGRTGEGVSSRGVSGEGARQASEIPNAYAPTAYAEMLRGDDLAALDSDREFARFVVEKAGLAFVQDETHVVVLGEVSMLVRIWVDKGERYVIRPVSEDKAPVFPGTSIQALKLGQFYASSCAGRIVRPRGAELARWKRRALIEWGVASPPRVVLRALPEDAPRYVRHIWDGIGLLVRVRRITEPDEAAFPLTRSFVPCWCGCDERQARRALHWLESSGFICRVESIAVGKPKPMTLWAIAESER